jgi:hypothetical protein
MYASYSRALVMPYSRGQDTSDRSRLIEAAMAVLWAVPDHTLNITVLNKALFYLDLVWLRDHGKTVTGQTYVAVAQGPVVAKYEQRLVERLERDGLAKQEARGMAKPVVALKRPDPLKIFPAQEAAELVAKVFSRKSSKKASDYSHENPGWKIAFRDGKPTPIDMEIALQQICNDDAWLDQPADEHLKGEFRNAAKNAVDF